MSGFPPANEWDEYCNTLKTKNYHDANFIVIDDTATTSAATSENNLGIMTTRFLEHISNTPDHMFAMGNIELTPYGLMAIGAWRHQAITRINLSQITNDVLWHLAENFFTGNAQDNYPLYEFDNY